MKLLNDREREHVGDLFKAAAEQLAAAIPGEIGISLDSQDSIIFSSRFWSSALQRHDLSCMIPLHAARSKVVAIAADTPWEEAVPLIMRRSLGPAIKIQEARWATARAFGLVSDRGVLDLPPEEMALDRLLLEMVSAKGIDLRRAVRHMVVPGGWEGDELPLFMAYARHRDAQVFARHEREGRPVLSTWLDIGRARYDGTLLALDADLPEAVTASAAGRRLGDVVDTGCDRLNERIIVSFDHMGGRELGWTMCDSWLTHEIELEPDHVRLGDVRSQRRRAASSR